LAIDGDGKAHLVVSDVLIGENNRLKVYWAIGDLGSKKWEKLYLVEHVAEFHYWSSPKAVSTKDRVHLILENSKGNKVTYLEHHSWNKKEDFSLPTIIHEGPDVEFDVAECQFGDSLLMVYSSKEGIFLVGHQDGTWRGARLLPKEIKEQCRVAIENIAHDRFQIRASGEKNRQFEVILKQNPKQK
jgi:hypothetical protein